MPIHQLQPKKQSTFSTRALGSEPARVRIDTPTDSRPSRPIRRDRVFFEEPPKRPRSHRKHAWLRGFAKVAVAAFCIAGIAGLSLIALYSRDLPDPNKIIEREVAQSTRIYDRTGETLLYEIHGTERRTVIELETIPQYAINATISIEDKSFFSHGGFSLPHLAKAITLEALSKVGLYRGLVPGGSTLTQQFIKNAILTTEKSYVRKLKELILAYRMEQAFSKEEILKLYFNEIPYGSTAYGIEAAAGIYFDKSAKDLTLAEAAVLAALPQAPSYYSPYGSHVDELLGRQQYILKLMVEQGFITEEEAAAANQQEIVFKKRREDIKAPHFVFYVKELLAQKYGERLIESGGLTIITTIDAEKQQMAEDAVNADAEKRLESYQAQNAALVSIDTETGEILAMVGSRDYFNDDIAGQVNVATALRQPGSSIKPVVYAAAFKKGYRPETTVYDLETSFAASGRDYRPKNYDGKTRGPVTLRQALQGSLNIPAVKVLYLVGVREAVAFAQELGYSSLTDPDRYGLSLVLGGAEVTLLEHTNAFATFAREGVYKPPVAVLKVLNPDGSTLEEHRDGAEKRVLDRNVARILSNVLSDNEARSFVFGAQNYLTLSGRPVAAKTGTTNDYHDAWTLGYTPQLATGVWVGNSKNEAMTNGADGSVLAAPIWRNYMQKALENAPVLGFKEPDRPAACDKPMVCIPYGERRISINTETGKLAGPFTPQSKIKEIPYRETHSILHYVDRADPLGPAPYDPSQDPQYRLWEAPIAAWAEEQGFINQAPPTETDVQYLPEDQPRVSITSPASHSVMATAPFAVSVDASARRGVRRVELFLGETKIAEAGNPPYTFAVTVHPGIPNGSYQLTAVAVDDIGNENRANIPITLDIPRSNEWLIVPIIPARNATYSSAELAGDLSVSVTRPEQIKKIDIYLDDGTNQTFVGVMDVVSDGNPVSSYSLAWTPPSKAGSYALRFVVSPTFGASIQYPTIPFAVTE